MKLPQVGPGPAAQIVFGLINIINNARCVRHAASFASGLLCEQHLECIMVVREI